MGNFSRYILCIGILVSIAACFVQGQSTTLSPDLVGTGKKKTTKEECAQVNSSCEECVKNPACLWCPTRADKCSPYPVGQIIPHKDYCDLSDARWGVCWLNYKALLITMGVIAGAIVLSISCCCIYCCCCRNKSKQKRKYQEEEAKFEREREERQVKTDERRADRQTKYDDIRKKYGLVKEDNPYQRFENE